MKVSTRHVRDAAGEEDSSPAYLTFYLGAQTLGIDVRDVRELLVPGKITPLPDARAGVLGVVDLRGAPLPVVDLRAYLGIPSTESTHEPQILVVEVAAGSRCKLLGVLVDGVRHVDEIPAAMIQPCPSIGISNWDSSIIEGLSLRETELVVLIRIDRIFGGMIDELALDGAAA